MAFRADVNRAIDLSTGMPLFSDQWDRAWYPQNPEQMYDKIELERDVFPLEMTYSHVSAEEVNMHHWTGVVRDWNKVALALLHEDLKYWGRQ